MFHSLKPADMKVRVIQLGKLNAGCIMWVHYVGALCGCIMWVHYVSALCGCIMWVHYGMSVGKNGMSPS